MPPHIYKLIKCSSKEDNLLGLQLLLKHCDGYRNMVNMLYKHYKEENLDAKYRDYIALGMGNVPELWYVWINKLF